jgi:hypothetical protein
MIIHPHTGKFQRKITTDLPRQHMGIYFADFSITQADVFCKNCI